MDETRPASADARSRTPAWSDRALRRYLNASYSPATRRAYRADWRRFVAYCDGEGVSALPAAAETLTRFLAAEAGAGRRPATLQRRLAAIRLAHRMAHQPSPTEAEAVSQVMRGIRREHGARPAQKAPLLAEQVKALADACDLTTTAGVRDRALLLLGFAAALRRSELVALDWDDVEWVAQGLRVHIRRAKTDQEGRGASVAVPHGGAYCPVEALRDWAEACTGSARGPVFRGLRRGGHLREEALSGHSVALIVQRYAKKLGWSAEAYAAHSLRAGWATSAALNHASLVKMQEVTRHKRLSSLQHYLHQVEAFDDHAGADLL